MIKVFRTNGETDIYTDASDISLMLEFIELIDNRDKAMTAKFLAGNICTVHFNDKLIYSRRKQLEQELPDAVVKMISVINGQYKLIERR